MWVKGRKYAVASQQWKENYWKWKPSKGKSGTETQGLPRAFVLPSFIDMEATRIYKDKQGACHITMKFTGSRKEFNEDMSNEDFTAFKNSDLTKEEVIAKYHKSHIEGYIRKEFSKPEKRSAALSLIEKTIFSYMKLYASSTYAPSANGDNNPRKRRNYDDIDDMNDEECKGRSYWHSYTSYCINF